MEEAIRTSRGRGLESKCEDPRQEIVALTTKAAAKGDECPFKYFILICRRLSFAVHSFALLFSIFYIPMIRS